MSTSTSPNRVRVVMAGPEQLAGAADALARAYHDEGFTNYMVDLSTSRAQATFAHVIHVGIESLRRQGETILVALLGDEPVGIATVSLAERQAQASLWAQLRWVLPHVPRVLGLLRHLRWRRLPTALRVKREPREVSKKHVVLMMLAVSPEHQGQGVGTQLLNAVRDVAERASDTEGIYLFTAGERNRRFYERVGYRVLSRVQGAPELVIYHMVLPLQRETA
jgi:GNAT superfamily N-acetyltransferase